LAQRAVDLAVAAAGKDREHIGQACSVQRGNDGVGILVVAHSNAEKIFAADKAEPIDDRMVGGDRCDMIAALEANRHAADIDAVPFADLPAGKLRHRHHPPGPPAQPRNKEVIGSAE